MNCTQVDSPFYPVWFGAHRNLCRLVWWERGHSSRCILCRQMGYIQLSMFQTLNESYSEDFKKGV